MTFRKEELHLAASHVLENAPGKMLCFFGDMGAGKTTLIKSIVKELGASDEANSPTFGLVNEYHDNSGNLLAYHFDFYRLENELEALDLGLDDYLSSGAWIFIEWPEKIQSLLPQDSVSIFLHFIDENTRSIDFSTD
ncbi:tRNA (adenosine(37)-N6)-threonylcarbamoyltransferase complex ATPase subunit type 1 TsaE [Flagellimonas onchidii]|uniref:tRNA (adenosine(37)-N6)-threonylcarbamoyltransferase complex ATPase subunit type 1 TsaE n=1 Tax=Flagellimonas onchidii TaxID=2562684 RepID=UPI0010A64629|nr:tRNA (adenosine(37)-N6)-threonylcarbamoyltransferase complex ATPase subunit type 1 TsaE [Allomuricauda onchidii]